MEPGPGATELPLARLGRSACPGRGANGWKKELKDIRPRSGSPRGAQKTQEEDQGAAKQKQRAKMRTTQREDERVREDSNLEWRLLPVMIGLGEQLVMLRTFRDCGG